MKNQNQQQDRATPRPWEVNGGTTVSNAGGTPLAKCLDGAGRTNPDMAKANAALIVKAVNEHSALREALANALNTIKALDENYDERDSYIQGQKVLSVAQH